MNFFLNSGTRLSIGQLPELTIRLAQSCKLTFSTSTTASNVFLVRSLHCINDFQNIPDELWNDPRFAFRVFLIQKTANRSSAADISVQLVSPDSEIAERFSVALKEVEKREYLPSKIVEQMKAEGFSRFTMDSHTKLWKGLDAKDPKKSYGAIAVGKQWCWYETWLIRVREECYTHQEMYR